MLLIAAAAPPGPITVSMHPSIPTQTFAPILKPIPVTDSTWWGAVLVLGLLFALTAAVLQSRKGATRRSSSYRRLGRGAVSAFGVTLLIAALGPLWDLHRRLSVESDVVELPATIVAAHGGDPSHQYRTVNWRDDAPANALRLPVWNDDSTNGFSSVTYKPDLPAAVTALARAYDVTFTDPSSFTEAPLPTSQNVTVADRSGALHSCAVLAQNTTRTVQAQVMKTDQLRRTGILPGEVRVGSYRAVSVDVPMVTAQQLRLACTGGLPPTAATAAQATTVPRR